MAQYSQAFNPVYPPHMTLTPIQAAMRPGRYDISVKEEGETIPAILIVDSTERNRDVYENPGRYTFRLPKQYTEVTSIELIQANVPSSGYAINESNCNMYVSVLGFPHVLQIGKGTYGTPDDLAAAVQDSLQTGTADATFGVKVDQALRVLHITCSNEFEFTAGRANGADQILGLSIKDPTLNKSSPAEGSGFELYMPYSFCLTTDPYIILAIQGMERCDSNNDAAQGAFCIIPLDVNNNFSLSVMNDNEPLDNNAYMYYFPEPLPKVGKLDITFYRTNGLVYDFNGRDHFLVFRVTCKSRQKKP